MIHNICIKIKERIEFISLENINRTIGKMEFNINKMFDFTNLNKVEKLYTKNEIKSINNHILIESKQKVWWKDNCTGNIFNTEIINTNTTTHNKSINEIVLGYDEYEKKIFLNTINMKLCNIKDKLINKNIINIKDKKLIENEDKFIENIDNKMTNWFECMKTMKNDTSKCYDIIFWKENNLEKIEFYINNKINIGIILENVNMISTLFIK